MVYLLPGGTTGGGGATSNLSNAGLAGTSIVENGTGPNLSARAIEGVANHITVALDGTNHAVQIDLAPVAVIKQYNCFITAPIALTIPLISYAEYGFTINGVNNLKTDSGTITASIQINGVDVTGLAGLSVSSTPQSPNATAANVVVTGDRLTLVLASPSSPANFEFTLKATI